MGAVKCQPCTFSQAPLPTCPRPRSCQKEPRIPTAGNAVFSFEDDLRRKGTAVACGPRVPRKLASREQDCTLQDSPTILLGPKLPPQPQGR